MTLTKAAAVYERAANGQAAVQPEANENLAGRV